ncbi:MAG: hypothetical protein ACOC0P_06530, partial [Planctomycetota bacterium]
MAHPLVEELREVGRKSRKDELLKTLAQVRDEEGTEGLRAVIEEIAALGSRWKGLLAHLADQ